MKFKKLLLSLGTVAAVAAPVAAVVACGVDETKVNYVFDTRSPAAQTLKKTIAANKGIFPAGDTIVASSKALDGKSDLEDRFVAFKITETTTNKVGGTDAAAGTPVKAFSKGSAVQLIKTVVQYLKDMDVKTVTNFKIEIAAEKITVTETTGADKKVTTKKSTPVETRATLTVTLSSTDVKNITEQLVDIQASNKSTPKDLIKAGEFVLS